MATLGQNTGTQLINDLASYLNSQRTTANGAVDTTQLAGIINRYLTTGEQLVTETGVVTNSIYKQFNTTDIVTAKNEIVTTGLWSSGDGSLTTFFTGSTSAVAGQSGSTTDEYYYNIYATATTASAEVEFAVSYGHISGAGAPNLAANDISTLPTKATYVQYRSLLLDAAKPKFTFYTGSTADGYESDDVYIVNVSRARYRERMDAGNISLTLSGSAGTITLIDDSGQKFDYQTNYGVREFNMVSGSLNLGTNNAATIVSRSTATGGYGYGKFYPEQGIILLNPTALATVVGAELTPSGSYVSYEFNHRRLFNAIKGGADFEARRTENVSTSHYFVRVFNREFNYSNNPTFVSGSQGAFYQDTFKTDPRAYITTIGLYNDANELLAVAKTSKPIEKSFSKELVLKVKLDF
jgi:hypothetical protein